MSALLDMIRGQGVEAPTIRILDVGALSVGGQDAWAPLVDSGAARLLGFEPQAEACAQCNAAAGPYRRYLPLALGDGRVHRFHRCNAAMTSSMYPPNRALVERYQNLAELMQVVEVSEIPTTRLDDIPEARASDLVKLDTQGFELTILEHGVETLRHASIVQTEVSFVELYQGQPLFADVDRFLRDQGFMLHTLLGAGSRALKPLLIDNDANRGLRQFLWSDAVYVRDLGALDRLPPDRLLKLAVLAEAVYRSFDLAHFVLERLDAACATMLARAYRHLLTLPAAA